MVEGIGLRFLFAGPYNYGYTRVERGVEDPRELKMGE
jgi:hypothetical protein